MRVDKWFLLLLVLSVIPILGYLHTGFPKTHDGLDHIARIANFYQNLQEGIIIPRWAGNLNWGFGHPVLEFLYPLPSFTASLFKFIGFSFVDSTKAVYIIGMFFSGITMYIWLKEFLDKRAAFIASLLYIFAPYRFVEIYVRGDIGENLGFVFMPLVLWSLYRLAKSIENGAREFVPYVIFGSISLAGLILSHNALSLMYLPLIIFYATYLLWNSDKKKSLLLNSFLLIILGFALSAFFWIPGLLEAKYTLRNIVTASVYQDRFVSFCQLLWGAWSYGESGKFTVQIGLVHLIFLLVGFPLGYNLLRKKDGRFFIICFLLVSTIVSLFLMLPVSDIVYKRVMLLQNFQFPWRFLAIPVFTTPVLTAYVLDIWQVKRKTLIILGLTILIVFANKDYWHPKGYVMKSDKQFTGIIHSTTDTGESAPVWSVRFMEETARAPMEVIDGKAQIKQIRRTSTFHLYEVFADTQTRLIENTLYFPGWEILIDKKAVPVEFQNPRYRGIMTFTIPKGRHRVEVIFKESKLRWVSNLISFITLAGIIGFLLMKKSNKNQ